MASPLPRHGPKPGMSSSSCTTVAPGGPRHRRRAVARGRVDHEQLVDGAGVDEAAQHGDGRADRRRHLARRHDDRDGRGLARRELGGSRRQRRVGVALQPRVEREVAREPAEGAPGGARRGPHARAGDPRDRDAGAGQRAGEGLVLERGARLEAADAAVGVGGDRDRGAAEVRVRGARQRAQARGQPGGAALRATPSSRPSTTTSPPIARAPPRRRPRAARPASRARPRSRRRWWRPGRRARRPPSGARRRRPCPAGARRRRPAAGAR